MAISSTIEENMSVGPLRPIGHGWAQLNYGGIQEAWTHEDGARVISAIEETENGWEFHVSVSVAGGQPPDGVLSFVASAFKIPIDSEDTPEGLRLTRHLWAPITGAADA